MESYAADRYHGIWNDQPVSFNRMWRGHRLTDDECTRLCAGEVIEIRGLKSVKTGKEYGVKAHLAECVSSSGNEYIGVDTIEYLKRGIPKEHKGHKFTEDELIMLESGMAVHVDDFISAKTGKPFSCKVTYNPETDRLDYDFNR